MEEYLFYLKITTILVSLHQGIAYAIVGELPLKTAARGAELWLGKSLAVAMLLVSLIGGLFVQPIIWMLLPTWLMVVQAVVGEVVVIRHLMKMKRQQQ